MKKTFGPKPLLYTVPVWVVGTLNKNGEPTVATASWAGVCSSKPPCVAVSFRRNTQTYHNIVERKAFTINIPSMDFLRETDYFGMASEKHEDKFGVSGLMPLKSSLVDAPYIEEFPVVAECKLFKTVEVGKYTQFIGEILDVKIDESVLDENGLPDVERLRPFCYDPENRTYYKVGEKTGKAFKEGKILKSFTAG